MFTFSQTPELSGRSKQLTVVVVVVVVVSKQDTASLFGSRTRSIRDRYGLNAK